MIIAKGNEASLVCSAWYFIDLGKIIVSRQVSIFAKPLCMTFLIFFMTKPRIETMRLFCSPHHRFFSAETD